MDIYEVLSDIMCYEGLSIAQVAKKCGLSDSTVRGIMTRKQKTVSLEVAYKLSDGLGVSLERLNGMEDSSEDKEKSFYETHATENEFENLVKKYRELDVHGKKMVDFTLNEEWERSTATAKENAAKEQENLVSISKYMKEGENENNTVEFSEELIPTKDYLLPNAAHADESLTEITEKMIQAEEDIMDDENF